ncbi:hypothetical protein BDN70DRAFT_706985 [Pholiota conissans]|uniref:Uncharacterized protein n=1 Tax=Pholiota conissans TaxID=109636 RepID=A0A9P6CZC3_9AGAR|nr:hypothetical protein BDN70DRAFT_706985 [Pholiota conissans]
MKVRLASPCSKNFRSADLFSMSYSASSSLSWQLSFLSLLSILCCRFVLSTLSHQIICFRFSSCSFATASIDFDKCQTRQDAMVSHLQLLSLFFFCIDFDSQMSVQLDIDVDLDVLSPSPHSPKIADLADLSG